MTEETKVETGRKPRPKYNPKYKEQGSKKKRWKKHHKRPKKDLGKSLEELQSFINGRYHAP